MKRLVLVFAGAAAVLVLAAVALWVATRGDYPVAATVTDDPDLPAIELLGIRLHAEAHGPEDGPVVVVLHGGPGGDYRSLLPLAALADDGYNVQFYDQRGAGLSERVADTELTLASHLDELDALIGRLSPDAPVVLLGHSWGAMLASAYLGRHPEKVAKAVLIEPGFLSAAEAEDFAAKMKGYLRNPGGLAQMGLAGFRATHVTGPDPDAANDFLVGQMVHWFASHPDNPYHCPGAPWNSPAWRYGARSGQAVQAQATPEDFDSLGDVQGFTGPVLLMSGACDSWIGPPLQERHLSLFPNATHVVIDDAGHDVVDDQPAAALVAIRSFLLP
ncbi:MAG: alpha/beta hydrolase [Maritimibacter sp.]|nr:alpha/beta hydrolase [Maritimibacter sp.]